MQRECEFAVEILMQALIVAGGVLQEKRRQPHLARGVARLQIIGMRRRIAHGDLHALVPGIGVGHDPRIERGPQFADRCGQGIFEIAVLALAEAVARHVDMAAEMHFLRIERRNAAALSGCE